MDKKSSWSWVKTRPFLHGMYVFWQACPHKFENLPHSKKKQATIIVRPNTPPQKTHRKDNMMEVMNVSHPFGFGIEDAMGSGMLFPSETHHSQAELQSTKTDVRPADVLCGRDKQSHSHVGNKRFRQIVMMHRQEYQSAPSRENKTNITCKIVNMIKECGGRFLKQDETTGEWLVVSDHYAREKVSHALRSAKDPNRPKVNRRRKVKKYVPTPEEDALFEATLDDQQRIFRGLLSKEAKGITTEIDFDDTESLLSGI